MSYQIKSVEMFNFAKVRQLLVEFGDNAITYIVGMNGSGKSTALNAIWAGFKGVVVKGKPDALIADRYQIIGDFEKTAKTEITLLDKKTGNEVIIKTKISKSGNEWLITDREGNALPDNYIEDIFNLMCIDPTSFTRMTPAQQALALGIDTSEHDEKIKTLKAERTPINNEVKRLEGVCAERKCDKVEKVDLSELLKEKIYIDHFNNEQLRLNRELSVDGIRVFIEGSTFDNDEDETTPLYFDELPFAKRQKVLSDHVLSLVEPVSPKSTLAIQKKIDKAGEINTKAAAYERYQEEIVSLDTWYKKQYAKNLDIKTAEEDREKYVKDSKLPFPNMAIDENGGLLVNGKPFCEPYFSTGEIWGLSAKLLASLEPELKTIMIRGANSLDDDKRKQVEDLAEKGYQIIFEFVGKEKIENRHTILLKELEVVESYADNKSEQPNL